MLLLVPHDIQSPLLAPGLRGSRPPIAVQRAPGRSWRESVDGQTLTAPTFALVLMWDGQVVPEGCDRATRVVNAHNYPIGGFLLGLMDTYSEDAAMLIAKAAKAALGCEAVAEE